MVMQSGGAAARNDDGARKLSHDLTGTKHAQHECGSTHGTAGPGPVRDGDAVRGADHDDELKHGPTAGSDAESGDEGGSGTDGTSVCEDGRATSAGTKNDGDRTKWDGEPWTQANSPAAARDDVPAGQCSGWDDADAAANGRSPWHGRNGQSAFLTKRSHVKRTPQLKRYLTTTTT